MWSSLRSVFYDLPVYIINRCRRPRQLRASSPSAVATSAAGGSAKAQAISTSPITVTLKSDKKKKTEKLPAHSIAGVYSWRFLLSLAATAKTVSSTMFMLMMWLRATGVEGEEFVEIMNEAQKYIMPVALVDLAVGVIRKDTEHTNWLLELFEKCAALTFFATNHANVNTKLGFALTGIGGLLLAANSSIDPDRGLTIGIRTAHQTYALQPGVLIDEGGRTEPYYLPVWRAGSRLLTMAAYAALNDFIIRWLGKFCGDPDQTDHVWTYAGGAAAGLSVFRSLAELSFGAAKTVADLKRSMLYWGAALIVVLSQGVLTFSQALEFFSHLIEWFTKNFFGKYINLDLLDSKNYGIWVAAGVIGGVAIIDAIRINQESFRETSVVQIQTLCLQPLDLAGETPAEQALKIRAAHKQLNTTLNQLIQHDPKRKSTDRRLSLCYNIFGLFISPAATPARQSEVRTLVQYQRQQSTV